MLIVKNVVKNYGNTKALKGVSINIRNGEIVGIIGPNGAGKTTLFKIITGLIKKDSGEIEFLKMKKISEIKELISYMPEEPAFREEFTVKELFKTHSLFYKVKRKEMKETYKTLIEIFNIKKYENKSLSTLSKGNRRKAFFMSSLANINKSKLLILDEPFDGLDPESRVKIRKFLKSLEDKIILFSSHTLFDVEKLADRIVFIKSGEKYSEFSDIEKGKLEEKFMDMIEEKDE